MHKAVLPLGALFAILGVIFRFTGQPSPPKLQVSHSFISLGEGMPNESLRGTLRLSNFGDEDLVFDISKSCACTLLQPQEGAIEGGGFVDVEIAVQLPEHAPSEKSASLLIRSNDLSNPVATCKVDAKSILPFSVSPSKIEKTVAPSQVGVQFEFTAMCASEDDAARIKAKSTSPALRVSQSQVGANCVVVGTLEQANNIDFYAAVEVSLTGDPRKCRIPIHYAVRSSLAVVPATIFYRSKAGGGAESETFQLLLTSRNEDLSSSETFSLVEQGLGWSMQELFTEQAGFPRAFELTYTTNHDHPPERVLTIVGDTSGDKCTVRIVAEHTE